MRLGNKENISIDVSLCNKQVELVLVKNCTRNGVQFFCTSGSDLCNSTNFMLKYTKNEKRCYKHGKEK